MSGSLTQAARSIRVWADQNAGPEALSKVLAEGAKQALHDAIQSGEAPELYTTYVDGVEGAKEEVVKPDGVIHYRFDFMAEVLIFALEFAKFRSPPRRGVGYRGKHYKDGWWIAKVSTGAPIKAERVNWRRIRSDDSYYVYNDMPYSRKIDVQTIGKRRLKFSAPPGLFDDLAAALRSRYGRFVSAKRRYTIHIPNQYIVKRGVKRGSPVDIPAVLVEPKPRG